MSPSTATEPTGTGEGKSSLCSKERGLAHLTEQRQSVSFSPSEPDDARLIEEYWIG
jgi:hypothetical protein